MVIVLPAAPDIGDTHDTAKTEAALVVTDRILPTASRL